MKSPANQKIIQIDVTNACMHRCSNCTRFCGHHRKPFFMDPSTFAHAVDSLHDFPGMIGMMGGEPTLHPQFASLATYLREHTDPVVPSTKGRYPIRDFAEYRNVELADVSPKRGLWTSLGPNYYRNFEIIQETFGYQCVNDHRNPGLHQALLISRKDLGIPDDDWVTLRDNCWVQNLWSSSITPKGAFFCEVAAALDMLFDGPGGWPIEPGWWKRSPDEFGDQLKWCELCSAALQVPRRPARDAIDDVSPELLAQLQQIDSPKVSKGHVRLWNPHDNPDEADTTRPSYEWYLPKGDNAQRISDTNTSLHIGNLHTVVCTTGTRAPASARLTSVSKTGDDVTVVTPRTDASAVRSVVIPDTRTESWCSGINSALTDIPADGWVALLAPDASIGHKLRDRLSSWILNPGCLYYIPRTPHTRPSCAGKDLGPLITVAGTGGPMQHMTCMLFHPYAAALSDLWPRIALLDKGTSLDVALASLWPTDKRVDLSDFMAHRYPIDAKRDETRRMARQACAIWQTLIGNGLRVALFGAGTHTKWFLGLLDCNKLPAPVCIFDDQPFTDSIRGIPVLQAEHNDRDIDAIVVSAYPGHVTEHLKQRTRMLFGASKMVVELYPGQPAGRFPAVEPLECVA